MSKTAKGILCPTCGAARMERVTQTVQTKVGRRKVTVPDVELDQCPRCGERLYDLAALRRIRAARDAAAA
jgi:YgiT-type zinc finger domain-containing protein